MHLYYPSGDGAGVCVLRKDNWNGGALSFPRERLDEALQRQELTRNGVYVLWGIEGQSAKLYVGEGKTPDRLKKHALKREFWSRAVVFVREGVSLDKADQLYLERRLLQLARCANRCELDNTKDLPECDSDLTEMLPEAKRAAAELFLSEMLLCLRALGIPEFDSEEEPSQAPPSEASNIEPWRVLTTSRNGCQIRAFGRSLVGGGFLVQKRSTGLVDSVPSFEAPAFVNARRKRQELLESPDVKVDGSTFELLRDLKFANPSMAEKVMAGRNGNGLASWIPTESPEVNS